MNIQAQIGSSVSNLVSFIKEKTVENIITATRQGTLTMDENEMRKLISVVESSISQGLTLGYFDVESTLKVIESKIKK